MSRFGQEKITSTAVKKKALPGYRGEVCSWEHVLVVRVIVGFGGCRLVEFAGRANLALAGIGPRKPGGHVPVQMRNFTFT